MGEKSHRPRSMAFSNTRMDGPTKIKQLAENVKNGRLGLMAQEIKYDEFIYSDQDSLENEVDEFYSFAEIETSFRSRKIFEATFPKAEPWMNKTTNKKKLFIENLLIPFESPKIDKVALMESLRNSAHCILYILQGVYGECESTTRQIHQIEENGRVVFDCNALTHLLNALVVSLQISPNQDSRKGARVAMDDVVLYLSITFFLLMSNMNRPSFCNELISYRYDDQPLLIILFNYLKHYNDKSLEGFPVKKLLIVIWKTMLATLGGKSMQLKMMNLARKKSGLPPLREGNYTKNTLQDLEDYEMEVASQFYGVNPATTPQSESVTDSLAQTLPTPVREGIAVLKKNLYIPLSSAQLEEFVQQEENPVLYNEKKVAQKAMEEQMTDPDEVNEFNYLNQRIEFTSYLYKAMYPSLYHYIVILLKVLVAAIPTLSKYNGTVNLMAELRAANRTKAEGMKTYMENLQDNLDSVRHKEIVSKSVTSIILLLLKHTKISHILQHEHISRLLKESNCILVIAKFLNHDIPGYCVKKNEIDVLKFLSSCINTAPIDDSSIVDPSEPPQGSISWRNIFTVVNLLRIMQKLTKRKPSRIQDLVKYKISGIIRGIVKLPHSGIGYYSLKILKSQIPFLGPSWRNQNMRIVTSIMYEIRSNYNDHLLVTKRDFNETEILESEIDLSPLIDQYNHNFGSQEDEENQEVDLHDLSKVELEEEFFENYSRWLDQELFDTESPLKKKAERPMSMSIVT